MSTTHKTTDGIVWGLSRPEGKDAWTKDGRKIGPRSVPPRVKSILRSSLDDPPPAPRTR